MKIETWVLAHFSPTGGTKKVADSIAAGLGTPVTELDLLHADATATLGDRDGLLAVLPVFGGRVPQIALDRLAAVKGNGQKAVAVVVYGNREFDDALLETKNALEANGFHVAAAAAFIAEHSIIRSIAAGRPDAADEALCRRFAADVMAKADDAPAIQVPGNDPYVPRKKAAFHPEGTDGCVQCGTCAAACPLGAIPMDDHRKTDGELCINCLHCIQVCPTGSRALPQPYLEACTKLLNEKAAGYKKPAVFL